MIGINRAKRREFVNTTVSKSRIAIFIAIGIMVGLLLAPTSGLSHVGGAVAHLWNDHIKPKADARYPTLNDLRSGGGPSVHYGNLTNVPLDGLVKTTSINASCTGAADPGESFVKIGDIGSFSKEASTSTIQVTFNGRLHIDSLDGGFGAEFELRVNDQAPTDGRARALVRENVDTGASMMGTFSGLAIGSHMVSMWVRTPSGTGTGAKFDPGCWSTDHVVVNEFR